MKFTRSLSILASITSSVVLTTSLHAQMLGGPPRTPVAEMARFFGMDRAFTATAHMKLEGGSALGPKAMEMKYATLNGKIRTEMDMAKMMGGGDANAVAMLKQMGMDRMVNIVDPAKRTMCMIYPSMNAYCSMNMPGTKAEAPDAKPPKVEKSELGTETVDGHACAKNKVTVTTDDGQKYEATVWEAKDLKDFPIQIQTQTNGGSVTMLFKDINTAKPEAALFEPPAGFKGYSSMQEMMMSVMQQRLQGSQ